MNNKLNNNTLLNLIKLNLQIYEIPKIISLSIILFLVISYSIIKPLNDFSLKNNLDINLWDGFFKVITYPIIVVCLYFIIVIIITSILNIKIGNTQYIIVRSNKKFLWILSRSISNLIIGLILTTIFFLCSFIMSYIFLGFDTNWSPIITNTKVNIKLIDVLYLNNFVFYLTPIQATILSFLQVYIATAIIISFRDIFSHYISNIYICDFIVTVYIFISIINYMYNLKIFRLFNHISLGSISIINFHNFDNTKIYGNTLTQSFIISLIFLLLLISINLIFSRRLEVNCD